MNRKTGLLIWILIGMMTLPSSACILRRRLEVRMGELSSAVTKLSANVESTVRYGSMLTNIGDSELLAKSTEHDLDILKFFSKYSVRIMHNEKDALILVCTKDQKRALLEDAGCTTELDSILRKEKPTNQYEFTTTIEKACTKQTRP